MIFSEQQVEDLVNLLVTLDDNTKIYLGTDSVRFKKDGLSYAKFASVAIVHMNGNKGCKIFSSKSTELDYDAKKNRPSMRLMNEVMKTCDLYLQLIPYIDQYEVEIHLDVNTDPIHGSNCVAAQAAGYVLGVTGIDETHLKLKPDALASSFGADWYANGRDHVQNA